jgi:hypothetical protein
VPEPVPLTVRGAPRGARILVDGKAIGEAPGPVSLAFGDAPVQVTVTAPGHEPTTFTVTPDHAVDTSVKLKRRAGARQPAAIPRDLESPF